MTETGIVVQKRPTGEVVVEVERTSACEGCHAKGACSMTFLNRKMRFVLEDTLGLSVGDSVTLQMDDGGFMKAALVVYGIPLMAMLTAVLMTAALLGDDVSDGILAVATFLGLGLGIVLVWLFERRLHRGIGNQTRFKVKLTGLSR